MPPAGFDGPTPPQTGGFDYLLLIIDYWLPDCPHVAGVVDSFYSPMREVLAEGDETYSILLSYLGVR